MEGHSSTIPLVFGETIGWLNPANGRRGVVIAGSHGFEDLCSRRFLAMMARRISACGLPVLQFDYPGWGNALGDHATPDLLSKWETSLDEAVETLKDKGDVDDVIVIGFRLGALLAWSAAARRDDISALGLLAPPNSGRAYLREQEISARLVDAELQSPPDAEPFDGITVGGCRLSRETGASLKAFNPFKQALSGKPLGNLLILGRGEGAANEAFAEQFRTPDRNLTLGQFDGYNQLMRDTTAQEIPYAVIEQCVNWAESLHQPGASPKHEIAVTHRLKSATFEEEPVIIGTDQPRLSGVICRPRQTDKATSQHAVIIPNSGANPQIGWARGGVELARTLAAHGTTSLRFDMPGLGQSEDPPEDRQYIYDDRNHDDVARIIDWLCAQGFERITFAGTCSGAHYAFHAAHRDSRVTAIAIVNILCFDWGLSHKLERLALRLLHGSPNAARSTPVPVSSDASPGLPVRLKGFIKSRIKAWGRPSIEFAKMALVRFSPATLLGFGKVERWMRAITRRGVHVLMVSSDGDLSHGEIARHFGKGGKRLYTMNGITKRAIKYADHSLTQPHARTELAKYLIEWEASNERLTSTQ